MTSDGTLVGKVAIVTGRRAGKGATASALTCTGSTVIGVARRSEEQAGPIGAPPADGVGRYLHVVGDVTLPATAIEVSARALEELGRIDILVNNAGAGHYADLVDTDVDLFDEIMATNMRSTYLFTRAVVEPMVAQQSGIILQISSQAGLNGYGGEAIYCASKHAQVGVHTRDAARTPAARDQGRRDLSGRHPDRLCPRPRSDAGGHRRGGVPVAGRCRGCRADRRHAESTSDDGGHRPIAVTKL